MIDRYLSLGWHIFPLRARAKTPLTKHGAKDATIDSDVIARWQIRYGDCGWGIACEPSHIFVVDVDGATGIAGWEHLCSIHYAPATLVGVTGGGGRHIVYHDPHGFGRNSAGRLAPSVDTRGRGGYIVAPPSIHPNGTPYKWQWADMAPIPNWIVNILNPRPPQAPVVTAAPAAECDRYAEAVLRRVAARLAGAREGGRNDALNHAAYAAGKLVRDGHAPPYAVEFLRDIATGRGLRQGEVEATWRSGYEAGYAAP